jgi:lipid A ethanolaminephosphotransferase
LLPIAASAAWFIDGYGIHIDPSMIRNVLRTDFAEALELVGPGLAIQLLLYAVLPLLVLWKVPSPPGSLARRSAARLAYSALAIVLLGGSLLANMQPLSSLMRHHKDARYLINPASTVWSLGVSLRGAVAQAGTVRKPIGLDARAGALASNRERPLRIVLVVGETVRGANWGLNGYSRDTTPELRRRGVINFEKVRSCGTNTEVSLPCMFAPVGRRAYDETTIRGSESLLHVLNRAGVRILWRDNQSGCKGVCEGLPYEQVGDQTTGASCRAGRCSDQFLFEGLGEFLDQPDPTALLALHMLGNHGPSYWRRYPDDRAIFQPDCRKDDLSQCSSQAIVNAYDNAVLYTDHLLGGLIDQMSARSDRHDTVLIYLSDHGESLGERGLFLHGMPWAIATEEQTWVPWIIWFSPGAAERTGVDAACLAKRARAPAQHDHLFHTLLSLTNTETALYDPAWDLVAQCRVMQ